MYTVPPQLRVGQRWYQGTADAVYQNIYLIEQHRPSLVVVLSGDHIYKMDYGKFVDYHRRTGAVATVSVVEVPIGQASSFGVVEVDDDWRVVSFREKPKDPRPVPGRSDRALVNMGVYCFETGKLLEALNSDAGHDILPELTGTGKLFAYPFVDENRKTTRYWRDIGTLDSYFEASLDLVAVHPVFNLYDDEWPIRTLHRQLPPAKTVFAQAKPGGRIGLVLDSIVSAGVIVSGGRVERSVLSPMVRVNSWARVENSVLMDGVDVGRKAWIRKAIIDKDVRIPPGYQIGIDPEEDRQKFTVTPGGVVVVPRGARLKL